jgi:hypothetical protein
MLSTSPARSADGIRLEMVNSRIRGAVLSDPASDATVSWRAPANLSGDGERKVVAVQ